MPRVDVSHLYIVCTRAIESAIDRDGDTIPVACDIEVIRGSIMLALYQAAFGLDSIGSVPSYDVNEEKPRVIL